MATKPALRAATDADAEAAAQAKKVRTQTLAQAAEGDDYLAILVAQRREMIRDVTDVNGPAKAALHRQIALHSKEISLLQEAAKQEADEDAETAPDEPFDAAAL